MNAQPAAAGSSARSAELLRRSTRVIRDAVAEAPHVPADWRPGPGQWSLSEVVTHLVDSMVANAFRFRQVLTEQEPELAPYAHEQWVRGQKGVELPLDALLDAHEAMTRYSALLLEQLSDAQWERCGREGSHLYTLRHIAEVFTAGHVDGHLRQIQRIQEAYNVSIREEGL